MLNYKYDGKKFDFDFGFCLICKVSPVSIVAASCYNNIGLCKWF